MKPYSRILSYLKGSRKELIIASLAVAIETSFELLIPFIMANMINEVENGSNANMDSIYIDAFIIILCALMSLVFGIIYSRFSGLGASKFGGQLRLAQFEKIQSYSFSNLDDFEPSSLVTRVINDTQVMQNVVFSGLRPLIRAPLMLVFGIFYSFLLNAKLSLVFIVLVPVLGVTVFLILKTVAPAYISLQKKLDDLNMIVQENLVAMRVIKSFTRKPYECRVFDESNNEFKRVYTHTLSVTNINVPVFQLCMYLSTLLFMWFGGNLIIEHAMKAGDLTGILSYVMQTFNSLNMISNCLLLFAKSLASVYRINEVFNEESSIKDGKGGETITKGDVEFKDVSFRYKSEAKENVLSHVSFKLEGGKTLGILGSTGSAKSTLVQLIPRLYDASSGEVAIDGVDVRDYALVPLRDSIAMVLQKSVLFEGTVLDNLKWGNPNPTEEDIKKVLEISGSDEFVAKLPLGLDTQVGEGGNELSGGQKQRLCLARALLKNPKILILDDTTSAVDTATDAKIRKGLAEIKGMTKIIISQRLLSVMDADEIMILSEGRVVQIGNHEELMKTNSIYQDLYNAQLKGAFEHGKDC